MLYEQNKIKHRDTRNHDTRVTRNVVNKTGEQHKWEKGCLLEMFNCEVIFAEAEANI